MPPLSSYNTELALLICGTRLQGTSVFFIIQSQLYRYGGRACLIVLLYYYTDLVVLVFCN